MALRRGQTLVSDLTQQQYEVTSAKPVASGGFGAVYRGQRVHARARDEVAIKLCHDRTAWHGEAYLGEVFGSLERVVPIEDSLIVGSKKRFQYILVSPWMEEGSLDLQLFGEPVLPERRLVSELRALLRDLAAVHTTGVTHRDIRPANVFLDRGRLRLGDFGIAQQQVGRTGKTVRGFAPAHCPPEHTRADLGWEPRDDVYMVGLLALSLLRGTDTMTDDVTHLDRLLRDLDVSDHLKFWLWHALGPRELRFHHAGEAARGLSGEIPRSTTSPRMLEGARIVFTGELSRRRSTDAAPAARTAGATVQTKVNGETTVIVRGRVDPRKAIGENAGRKLFDAWLRLDRNQPIAIIDEKRFETLLARSATTRL